MSDNTLRAYRSWTVAYVRFHGLTHPRDLGAQHVRAFLTTLARELAPSTVNQAHAALSFLYLQVLRNPPAGLELVPWSRTPTRVPTVLSRDEVRRLLATMPPRPKLAAALLYGSGLRISEALSLRVKDLDLERLQVVIREGKGCKDRIGVLPKRLVGPLGQHMAELKHQHGRDISRDAGWVELPVSMANKAPTHGRRWPWQWVFCSPRVQLLPTGQHGRRHQSPSTLRRALARAGRVANIPKRVHPHVLRHSFGTHMVEDGVPLPVLQRLMGHRDVRTTMLYVHVARTELEGVRSPLDRL